MSSRFAEMTIPALAVELRVLAARHALPELSQIADAMRRRRPSLPAKPSSRKTTDELLDQIRDFARANIGMSQMEIANRFGTNQGRVSEALHGKRGKE
jgi:hypothetical protein